MKTVLFAAICLAISMAEMRAAQSVPNIVYILADDLGYGDVGCQNPKSKIPTPVLDRLAGEGIRFTDAHDPTAVCTPTRYSILTGRYCWRSNLKRGVLGGYSAPLIESGRLTVPALLKRHGYATACIGKWHLGLGWGTKEGRSEIRGEADVDFSQPIKGGPREIGFDYFYGLAASLDMPPYVWINNDRVTALPTARQAKAGYVREGPKDPSLRFEEVLPHLTEKAVDYIEKQKTNAPFFLYLALNAPHTPIAPAQFVKGKSKAGDYGDFVAEVDWAVGQVLAALEKGHLSDNTLVILTSDNGPEVLAYGRAQQFGHYSMGDWRGVKRDTWEGGHRVPFLARWPGHIKPGSLSDEPICQTDLLATVAELLETTLPANAGEDSSSILPALLGKEYKKPIHEAIIYHSGSGKFAIRKGNWVLIDSPSGDDNKEPQWLKEERGYEAHNFPAELYNLELDPGEHRNLYAEQPQKVQELKALLEKFKTEERSVPLSK